MTAIRDITDRLLAEARAQDELHRRAIVGAMLAPRRPSGHASRPPCTTTPSR
jgi:hypothetical protein